MASEWTDSRCESLKAFCDCIFPSLKVRPDPHGFWARSASDFGIHLATQSLLDRTLPAQVRASVMSLLDAFAANSIASLPQEGREQLVHAVAASTPEAAAGVFGLEQIVLSLCYTLTDEQGTNPNWPALRYAGPPATGKAGQARIRPLAIECDELTLDADVCVVGSGAGGSVIAEELARRGLSVVVLEAGAYYDEGEFSRLERWAFQNLYWRVGYTRTADHTVQLLSGATLGGCTTISWQSCVRTPAWVRAQWAREHGLEQLTGAPFERQLDAVLERIRAHDRVSSLNGPHQRLEAGARKLGYSFQRCARNLAPAGDPGAAFPPHAGEPHGGQQRALNAYLEDAYRAGARIVTRARADRILLSQGRARGVVATCVGRDGRAHSVRVRAPQVVAACGALETPALLIRSGIAGPAVGNYLRLQPMVSISGLYPDDQHAWWGSPQAGLSDQFQRLEQDHGILIECTHHSYSAAATALPWRSGRGHKEMMIELRRHATFSSVVRDRGHGRVDVDARGQSVPFYPLRDALDIAHLQRGIRELVALHEAAGAERIVALADRRLHSWRRGQDLEAFRREIGGSSGGVPEQLLSSAHQMGTARMGRDPETSVARPSGELHSVRGVWIGDTSAFPTALGVNPMVTCMALAACTAAYIAR